MLRVLDQSRLGQSLEHDASVARSVTDLLRRNDALSIEIQRCVRDGRVPRAR